MTQQGVVSLYEYLGAAWPLVIRPGVDDQWKRAKYRELFQTYRTYTDEEVLAAFQKWTEEHDKFPTTKNIINEIIWSRRMKSTKGKENTVLWPMDFIKADGSEWTYGSFKRDDFVNHPKNTEHLQPEEWERRFRKTRNRILKAVIEARGGHVNYEAGKAWVDSIRSRHAESM